MRKRIAKEERQKSFGFVAVFEGNDARRMSVGSFTEIRELQQKYALDGFYPDGKGGWLAFAEKGVRPPE